MRLRSLMVPALLLLLAGCGEPAAPAGDRDQTTGAASRQAKPLPPPPQVDATDEMLTAEPPTEAPTAAPAKKDKTMAKATFGNGCFWCTEAVFQRLAGVASAISGYSGGHKDNPTYEEVCAEVTGHAEVIHVEYDPSVVTYEQLLEVFFKTHDPTTLNRQGNDVGTQYRSAIFYHDEDQRKVAEQVKARLDEAKIWPNPIVTEITAFKRFWPAETKHQDYWANNPDNRYCQWSIPPKLEKLEKLFAELLEK